MDTTNTRVGVGEWSALPRVGEILPSTPTRIIVPASEYELMRIGSPHSDDGHNKRERRGRQYAISKGGKQISQTAVHGNETIQIFPRVENKTTDYLNIFWGKRIDRRALQPQSRKGVMIH